MNEQMNKDIEWLTKSLGITEKKQESIIISKFDKEYYRNRYVASMASLSEKTTTIVDLQQQLLDSGKRDVQLIMYKNYNKLAHEKIADLEQQLITLTETSQLDNTGNNNNE